jgi:hypothetical protein
MTRREIIRRITVRAVCSVCKEPVGATSEKIAYRHGFKRHKRSLQNNKFSQEDGTCCEGSGKPVVWENMDKDMILVE